MKAAFLMMLTLLGAGAAQVDPLAPEEVPDSVTPPEVASAADASEDQSGGDNGRIVGGERAPSGTVPWQIEIFSPNAKYTDEERAADRKKPRGDPTKIYLDDRQAHELAHKCGGSYIGGGWILTAAHCVPKLDLGKLDGRNRTLFTDRRIRMGTQNLTAGGEAYQIEKIIVHDGYSSKGKQHDIALIKVREEGQTARLGARLKPISLHQPSKPLFNNEDVWVYGWGWLAPRDPGTAERLAVNNRTQQNPAELQQARLKHIAETRCKPYYPNWLPGMLCVGANGTGRDSCQGDSGGPLVRIQGGEKILVGIVSNGYGCAYKDIPAVYTRVSFYLPWIAQAQKNAPAGFSRYALK
jgi:secreted trypsin-like serine protease